ncbi:YeiH family protein [Porcipelethomonas sp.]|uniref:YeiH family protein n=1 Tax=Porcipelethomonas sp. TaxID=2981675 RepID=UPI003EF15F5A
MGFIKKNISGILLCLCIAVPSWFLGKLLPVIGGPVFAIIAGMILTMIIKDKSKFQSGIAFTSKKILQYAVILLGFGLNLSTILKTGKQSLPIIVSTIATSLIVAFAIHKLLKVPSKISTLIGVGSSICGGSAIAATAPVIDADDEEIAQSISVIFLFNILAALIFPSLGGWLGLSNEGFGIFAGTAVNDTSSVTAAASAWDDIHGSNTLDTATIVKLTRTLAIIPITLVLSFVRIRKEKNKNSGFDNSSKINIGKIFPMFIIYFILASVITTIVSFVFFDNDAVINTADSIFGFLKNCSKFLIIMAMAAIGLNTNIVKLVKTGIKPIFMGLCCWIAIAGVSLLMQRVIGIW